MKKRLKTIIRRAKKADLKPKQEETIQPVYIEEVVVTSTGPACFCGQPLAEGQTEVCREHIRRG